MTNSHNLHVSESLRLVIEGRSPSYTVRQLFDIQLGNRIGLWADLMKPVVAKLTVDDMISIAAYTASREPSATGTR